jgi:hypothetical protein
MANHHWNSAVVLAICWMGLVCDLGNFDYKERGLVLAKIVFKRTKSKYL